MTIIDSTIFNGDINIPNRVNVDIKALIELTIDEREPQLLTELLGYGFYKDLMTGLAVGSPLQKWIDLRDGKDYTVDTITYHYAGIKNMIANYVWFWFMRAATTNTTGIGQILPIGENGISTAPLTKMVESWNKVKDYSVNMVHFLNNNVSDYPEWETVDSYCWDKWYNNFIVNTRINVFGI